MKTRTAVRAISFSLAIAAIAFGYYLKAHKKIEYYKLQIENSYSKSLDNLNASVNNISLILDKASYAATGPQLSTMAVKLLGESETAKNSLSQLPYDGGELTVLNRFLSQVGNYAMSISKNIISGEEISEQQYENLQALSDTAKKIATAISDCQINYNNLDSWSEAVDDKINKSLPEGSLADSLSTLEENLADYPTLTYDGPYSDHILNKEPTMLKDAVEVTKEAAVKAAATAAICNESDLKYDGTDNGKLPAYRFSNENVSVTVSRFGGYVVYMRKFRAVQQSVLSYNQALEKAKRYLSRCSIDNMIETYYYTDEGICVISFAYLDGETICYTDLVKVGVAMDNGEIMLLECKGYLSNHTERAFETPTLTPEQAQEIISKNLTVKQQALALIPTDSGREVRCYEFLCAGKNNEDILVYVNCSKPVEEQILILLRSDGGTLTK